MQLNGVIARMKNKKQALQRGGQEPPEPYLPLNKLISAGATDFGLPHGLQNYLEVKFPIILFPWALTLTRLDLRANEPHD